MQYINHYIGYEWGRLVLEATRKNKRYITVAFTPDEDFEDIICPAYNTEPYKE